MNLIKIHFLLVRLFFIVFSIESNRQVFAQQQCETYDDFFTNLNKYDPEFDCPAYTTDPIRVDQLEKLNLLFFKISDLDGLANTRFNFSTNDSNFFIEPVINDQLQFSFNFKGRLFYNINNAHRYVVKVTVSDNGFPSRSSSALFIVPLINYNVNAPQYTSPVTIAAAITLQPGTQLAILNAWDIDGDNVYFTLELSKNTPDVISTLKVQPSGVLILDKSLVAFSSSVVNFVITLTDDGSSCGPQVPPADRIIKSSSMYVTLLIIEVNMHSPQFIINSMGINYCETTYKVDENTKFEIEIVATDEDERSQNGNVTINSPEMSDRSPQNSFLIRSDPQIGRDRRAIVYNKEEFDYENPKYGSNTMNIMFYAEDNGDIKRRGYCFMTIEIQDVNDNIPIFAQSTYTIYIHEQYKTRNFNYRFVAIDADSGDNGRVEYFMETEPPYNNEIASELFSLSLDGSLSIKNISCLDLVQSTMVFYIYATDLSPTRNRSALTTVRVINDKLKILPPFFLKFPDPPVIRNVSEMEPRGSLLRSFDVVIQTNPLDQFLRCFLSPKPNPEWFKFEFPSMNRELNKQESCQLKIEDPLNYRVSKEMIIYMVAEVGNYLQPSTARELKILTIELREENINSPKFVTSTIDASVVEGSGDLNKVIAVVKAYDLDITSPFNKITYEFDSRSNLDRHFMINRDTGAIKLQNPIHNKKNIPLTVIAKDGANGYNKDSPNQNSIYVDVKVIDINDNPPVFSNPQYEFTIPESARPGFVIGTIEVLDEDTETVFNYSISDATFGIRGIFDQTRTKMLRNYRGSAEIYLNNYLDFKLKSKYDLDVYVTDSQFLTSAKVVINIKNVNDRAPEFLNVPYSVRIKEMTTSMNRPIVTLSAKDDDGFTNDFFYQFYSTPYLNASEYFRLDSKTGEMTLINGLDRDLPNGRPEYNIPVSVTDMGGNELGPSLTSYTKVQIILEDLNDNAPYLVYAPGYNPLIIKEMVNNQFVEVYVMDNDEPINGPPFKFELNTFTDLFRVSDQQPCQECLPNQRKYRIINMRPLNRDVQKSYAIDYTLSDIGDNQKKGVLQIIVGDIDNNDQFSAEKNVEILTFKKNLQPNSFLGTLYTRDKDDWDLITKRATQCVQSPIGIFRVGTGLQIFGPLINTNLNTDESISLECQVNDQRSSNVSSKVDFSIRNIEYKDIQDLSGIRIFGITAENLALKIYKTDVSYLDKLKSNLAGNLNADVNIVTLRNYVFDNSDLNVNQIPDYDPSRLFGADLYFYATSDNKYLSSRLIYNIIYNNLNQLESIIPGDYTIKILFDECPTRPDSCPSNLICRQSYLISQKPLTVDANATGIVGMNNKLTTECYCDTTVSRGNSCFNGGTLVSSDGGSDYYCQCPSGYNGPRCEYLSLQFRFSASSPSHSYALFEKFTLCDPIRIEFEFSTDRSKGLLLFNGPVNRDSSYFVAVEIFDKTLLVHIGYTNISFPNIEVSDKKWHRVDISMSLDAIQVTLDKCQSKRTTINNYAQMLADKQDTDDVQLSLGGIPPSISTAHYYYKILNVFEYEGCIRNLRVNSELRDLKLGEFFNLAENTEPCDCKYSEECTAVIGSIKRPGTDFPWWIILIIVAGLLMLATIMGIALCSVRRKDNLKKMLQMFPDDDIRETIINYADGAGEENTENFNIGVMKKPVSTMSKPMKSTIQELSNDQNMIYSYEGEGSDAGSLSSVESYMIENDQDFDYLQDWGPKFQKLSRMYSNEEATYHYQS